MNRSESLVLDDGSLIKKPSNPQSVSSPKIEPSSPKSDSQSQVQPTPAPVSSTPTANNSQVDQKEKDPLVYEEE